MPTSDFDPAHMIQTAGDGRLDGPSNPAQVRALVEAAVASGHVVVHLHGGLVMKGAGIGGAADLVPLYRAAGAWPVAFIWQTGPEIVCHNLKEIASEGLFKRLLTLVLRWAAGRILAGADAKGAGFTPLDATTVNSALKRREEARVPFVGLAAAPGVSLDQSDLGRFEKAVAADPDVRKVAASLAAVDGAKGAVGSAKATLLDPDIVAEIAPAPGSKGIAGAAAIALHAAKVLSRVIRRLATGRDHGLYATVVEELAREFYITSAGGAFWALIKGDAADTFVNAPGVPRGGALFVRELTRATAGGTSPRISIVAHSAGSIFACHLLRALAAAGFAVADVVFIAAAVRNDLLAAAWKDVGHIVKRFHSIALHEHCESGYWEVPGFYPRSLLYMVSGAAERDAAKQGEADVPLAGMQRFHRESDLFDTAEDRAVRALIDADPSPLWLMPADGVVFHHGGLTDPDRGEPTIAAVMKILQASP